jgi:NADH-quinone oxidoreductase subunit A
MLENYFPVLMFMLVGLGFGVAPILGRVLAPYRPDTEKLLPTNAASRRLKMPA